MDKKVILAGILKELEQQRMELQENLDTTQQAAVDAPGAMQSKSDTTKFQMNTLANAMRCSLTDKDQVIHTLKDFSVSQVKDYDTVQIGAIVEIKERDGQWLTYFLLTQGGGTEIHHADRLITIVTPNAPISGFLLGKKEGDTVKFPIPSKPGSVREMTVTHVW